MVQCFGYAPQKVLGCAIFDFLPHELWEHNVGRMRSSRSLFFGFILGTFAMLHVAVFWDSPLLALATPAAFSIAAFAAGGLWRKVRGTR